MPHLTLEYTGNIDQEIRVAEVFPRLHQVLEQVADVDPANCKSRAIRLDCYWIGLGDEGNAFVHLTIRLLAGRSAAVKRELGGRSLRILEEYFAPSAAALALQLTVEVVNMERQGYFKAASDAVAA
jgi:5-carboxymethyl-2-hydroxymuconate isomerase